MKHLDRWIEEYGGPLVGTTLFFLFYIAIIGPAIIHARELLGLEPHQPVMPAAQGNDAALATYTLWLVIFTAILAASTIGLWLVTAKTLRHAQEEAFRQAKDAATSLSIAERSAQAAIAVQRPWLSVSVYPRGPMLFDEKGCKLRLGIKIANVGNTPAIAVSPLVAFIAVPDSTANFNLLKEKFERRAMFAQVLDFGQSLFPKGDWDIRYSGQRIAAEEVSEAVKNSTSGKITLNLIVGVRYRFPGGQGMTSQAFIVWTSGSAPGQYGTIDPSLPSLPAQEVKLHPMPLWNTTI